MQLIKGLFIAAVICVASVSAEQAQKEIDRASTAAEGGNGFSVQHVNFASNTPDGQDSDDKTNNTPFILAASVAGCVCIGVLGAVYLKRRKDNDKLQGDIFTIDDKNSVL